MLDSIGDGASIELPDGIQGRAWQRLCGGTGGTRGVVRVRVIHSGGVDNSIVEFRKATTRHQIDRTRLARRGIYRKSSILAKTMLYLRQPAGRRSRILEQPLPHGRGSDQSRDRQGAVFDTSL